LANTSASSTAPAPVKNQPSSDTGPAAAASDDGSRNTPEPIMLPTTRAVAIHRPIVRLGGAPLRCAPLPFVFECWFMTFVGRVTAMTGQTPES